MRIEKIMDLRHALTTAIVFELKVHFPEFFSRLKEKNIYAGNCVKRRRVTVELSLKCTTITPHEFHLKDIKVWAIILSKSLETP